MTTFQNLFRGCLIISVIFFKLLLVNCVPKSVPEEKRSESEEPFFDYNLNIEQVDIPLEAGTVYTLSRNPNDVNFYFFYNPLDINESTEIIYNDTDSLINSGFIPYRRTVFITHGFRSNYKSNMPQTLKNAFLAANANQNLNVNIIVPSWGHLSTPLPPELTANLYFKVTNNVPIVAQRLADFILFLCDQNVLSLSNVYLIGHSLGAHVSGLAGRNIFLATGEKIPRITGLDPAGPHYYPPVATKNLMKDNAQFTDVIHSDVGVLGDITNDGDIDFYPNGGSVQPGCGQNDFSSPNTFGQCSHWYAYQLYAASLTKSFLACPCDMVRLTYVLGLCSTTCENPVPLGYYTPSTYTGEYFLITAANPP